MRNRSNRSKSYADTIDDDASCVGGIFRLSSLTRRLIRRPKDLLGLCLTLVAAGIIIVNAIFLQAGPHPAAIFANSRATATGAVASRPAKTPSTSQHQIAKIPELSNRAEILEPSSRVLAVQRVLAEFGYGQIKVDGVLGPETKAAIERFERERNLPVTGQISEHLARELTVLTGRPL